MKSISRILAIALATGLAVACSTRNSNTARGDEDTQGDSVEQVAPASDGMPAQSSPANPGSPPDSAAQAVEPDSIRRF
ncbi:MAG: hypothetical protein QM762_08920 [Chryseolinea sp.]